MARPRNNITKLPRPLRKYIARMLDDGATYDDVRTDPEVIAACNERGLELHNKTFLAYRSGAEFIEFTRLFRERDEEMDRNAAAACLAQEGATDDIADAANYELMRILLDKLHYGATLEAKEISSIATALAAYDRNRISANKEDSKREHAEKEAGYQAEIAKLQAIVAAQSERLRDLAGDIDGSAVADAMNKTLGVGE